MLLHEFGQNLDRLGLGLGFQIRQDEFLGAETRYARSRVVAIGLFGHVLRGVRVGCEQDAPAAGACDEVLGESHLLALGDRDLHPAYGAATVGHRREHDMALLVQAVVQSGDLRLEFLHERINRIVQLVQMAAVASLVVFVANEYQLLELPEVV